MNIRLYLTSALCLLTLSAYGQTENDTTVSKMQKTQQIDEVVVQTSKAGSKRMTFINGVEMGRDELFKAACCNLGESFVNNPSVDVNYSDATTGAKQIKLLGLGGTYVQMLTENLPNFRGAAQPYGFSYVPGTWMKSIQVSKGNSSVKNGYEAMTGQINVEYLKPEDEQQIALDIYGNSMSRLEASMAANVHIGNSNNVATELLGHFSNNWSHHDGNGDGFQDDPQVRQYNFQNRWYAKTGRYLFHGGLALLKEDRMSGQVSHHGGIPADAQAAPLFRIGISTNRYEGYMKHAFILDAEHGTNIAVMGNLSMHEQQATYGLKAYDVNQKNAYASLMYETTIAHNHNFSAGVSLNHDYLSENYRMEHLANLPMTHEKESETTPGAYIQYTYSLGSKLSAMAGMRVDHSNRYGTFCTPRFHLKWMMNRILTLRASAGKGYRTAHALAEYNYLMASGRKLEIEPLRQEEAWNYGASLAFYIPLAHKTLKLNTEYYYTHFNNQAVVDYDSDPAMIYIGNLKGRSYSHTFQIDASYPLFRGMEVSAAYRYNLVKTNYGGQMLWKPLQSRYKGLLTLSYSTPMRIWQFDATLALNGGGRMPTPYTTSEGNPSWDRNFKAYEQINFQVTREFRHFKLFAGGENLTAFKQKHPIVGYHDPWSATFDPTMVYGPVSGAMGYIGVRFSFL